MIFNLRKKIWTYPLKYWTYDNFKFLKRNFFLDRKLYDKFKFVNDISVKTLDTALFYCKFKFVKDPQIPIITILYLRGNDEVLVQNRPHRIVQYSKQDGKQDSRELQSTW